MRGAEMKMKGLKSFRFVGPVAAFAAATIIGIAAGNALAAGGPSAKITAWNGVAGQSSRPQELKFTDEGTGAAVSPSVDLGVAASGELKAVAVMVRNTSRTDSLLISHVKVSPRKDFELASQGCPAVLAPLQYCTMAVRFKPSRSGRINGKLSFDDNTAVGHRVVKLSGSAE